jgi:hypothetical protein
MRYDLNEDANTVGMDYISTMRVQSYLIPPDNTNTYFSRLLKFLLVLDTGSKPTVFRMMQTFTQYAPCQVQLTLIQAAEETTFSTLNVSEVGNVGGLMRCLHVPESDHNLSSISHYMKNHPKLLFS